LTPKPDLRDRSTLLASFSSVPTQRGRDVRIVFRTAWVRLKAAGGRVVRKEVGKKFYLP